MEKLKLPKLTHEVSKEILEEHEKEMQRIALEEPKYIQFGFANGEVINVDIEDVHEMELSEISEKHYLSQGCNIIEKYKECTKVEITLLSFANKGDYDHFKTCYTFDKFLTNNYIVDITYLNSNKDLLERIYVPWNYSSRDFNSYQKTRKNKIGQLEILIGKDAQFTDDSNKELLSSICDQKVVSITSIQRMGYGYNAASKIYKELMNKGFIDGTGKVNKANICKEIGKEYTPAPKFIFLDIDGVLNCKSTKDKIGVYRGIEDEKVALLKEIVDKTDAKIILISSWKEKWHALDAFKDRQDELANYLDEKLSKFGLKASDKVNEYGARDRGDAINQYIKKIENTIGEAGNFVILDDETFDYKYVKLAGYLIQTSYDKNGLTRKHADKAIELLNR